jgi:cardiolipin synthase A/B
LHSQDRPSAIHRRPLTRLRRWRRIVRGTDSDLSPRASDPAALCPPGQTIISGNDAELLQTADEALPRMLDAIRRATRAIDVEMYCFADDFVGCRFARALAERAEQGVAVRVLVDAAGSRATPRSFFGWMREHGIRVRGVNPIRKFLLHGGIFRWRDHRKLVVVDGAAAFVGGLNLSRDYASPKEGGCGWRDAAVRVTGPVVSVLAASFDRHWREEAKGSGDLAAASAEPARAGDVPVMVLESRPLGPGPFAAVFRHAVDRARRRIWIASPYFLPPRSFRRALRRAAGRGVDVRILVPRSSDCPFVLRASQRSYAYYLRSGIRLFEWPGVMMHSKAAMVDGVWSTIGSYNIDPLSLLVNRELNLVLLGRSIGRRFEAMFERDFAGSVEVDAARWTSRGTLRRAAEHLCSAFRVFL